MKQVKQVTVLLSIFANILYAVIKGHNPNLFILVTILISCFIAAGFIITISEIYKLDKEVEENNNQFLTLKNKRMEKEKDSLNG